MTAKRRGNRSNSPRWRHGSTSAWRRIRLAVLAANVEENGGRCQLALAGCTGTAQEVHHIRGAVGSDDNPAGLQAVCRHCNLLVGDPRDVDPEPTTSGWWSASEQPTDAEINAALRANSARAARRPGPKRHDPDAQPSDWW